MTELRPGAWRRAGILALVIGVHLVMAAPVPHVVSSRDLRKEASQRELRAWAGRLGALGIELTPEELGEQVVRHTRTIGGLHRAAKAPWAPLRRLTGTNQGWALFAIPSADPPRLEIRVRRRGSADMETLFLHLDPEHDWWREQLVYRRVRGNWNSAGYGPRPSSSYRRFAHFVGRRILAERPEVDVVVVRQLVGHTPLPGEAPAGEPEPRFRVVTRREP